MRLSTGMRLRDSGMVTVMVDWLRRYVVFDENDEALVVISDGPGDAAASALDERDIGRESVTTGTESVVVFPESLRRCYRVTVEVTYTAGAIQGDGEGHYKAVRCRPDGKALEGWRDAARDALLDDKFKRDWRDRDRIKRGLPPLPEQKMQADPAGHRLFLLAFYPKNLLPDWRFFRLPIARVDAKRVWLLPRRFDPLQTQSLDAGYLKAEAAYDQPPLMPGTLWVGPDKDQLLALAKAHWEGEARAASYRDERLNQLMAGPGVQRC